jgi:hypothetical protein
MTSPYREAAFVEPEKKRDVFTSVEIKTESLF